MPTRLHELRGMRISKLSPGRRTDTNTGGTQSRRDAGACRPTSPNAPKEHGTRPTTTWDDYPAMETMHRTAQPRQHASDRGQQAQRTHRPTTHTRTGKRRPHRHTQACCNGLRGAGAGRACGASAPSRSDPKYPPSRTLQAGEPMAELPAPRREKRSMLQLSRTESRMSSRPPGWPMRSSRSPTAAWTTCGRRAVEVGEAGCLEAGGEAADIASPGICDRRGVFGRGFDGGIHDRGGYAAVKVAACHTFHGAVQWCTRGEAISRQSGER